MLSNLEWDVTFRDETAHWKFWQAYKESQEDPILAYFDFGAVEDTQERLVIIKVYTDFIEEKDVRFWLWRHCEKVENVKHSKTQTGYRLESGEPGWIQ